MDPNNQFWSVTIVKMDKDGNSMINGGNIAFFGTLWSMDGPQPGIIENLGFV